MGEPRISDVIYVSGAPPGDEAGVAQPATPGREEASAAAVRRETRPSSSGSDRPSGDDAFR